MIEKGNKNEAKEYIIHLTDETLVRFLRHHAERSWASGKDDDWEIFLCDVAQEELCCRLNRAEWY